MTATQRGEQGGWDGSGGVHGAGMAAPMDADDGPFRPSPHLIYMCFATPVAIRGGGVQGDGGSGRGRREGEGAAGQGGTIGAVARVQSCSADCADSRQRRVPSASAQAGILQTVHHNRPRCPRWPPCVF